MCKCVTGCQGPVIISFEVKNEKDFGFRAPPLFLYAAGVIPNEKKCMETYGLI